MNNALTATGIAFSGAPREYTGLVMAKQRQAELDAKLGNEKKDKEYAKLYEQINVKSPDNFFTFDLQDVQRDFAETIDKLSEAKAKGDYKAGSKIANDFQSKTSAKMKQKTEYDYLMRSKDRVFDPSLTEMDSVPSREEAAKTFANREGVQYNPETNQFTFNANQKFDDQKFFTDLSKSKEVYAPSGRKVETPGPYGSITVEEEFVLDKDAYAARLENQINKPQVFQSVATDYKINNPDWREMSEFDFNKSVKDDFISRGMSFVAPPDRLSNRVRKGAEFNNTFNIGGGGNEQNDVALAADETEININQKGFDGQVYKMPVGMRKTSSFGDFDASLAINNTTFYMDGNERVEGVGLNNTTYNEIGIALLAKEDLKLGNLTISKGQLITKEAEKKFPEYINAKYVTYGAIALGAFKKASSGDSRKSIYTEYSLPARTNYSEAALAKQPNLRKQYDLRGDVDKLNSELPTAKEVTRAESEKAIRRVVSPKPTPAAKEVVSPKPTPAAKDNSSESNGKYKRYFREETKKEGIKKNK